ncbi:hypothetical protein A3H75_00120 [Candidatus Uhrbacteria bacterium RIFCSPLOWO2_02_FULL_51_9]|uniref:D-glycerate dehydrogenase n=1 Tax=Candidatus Uhrbacteria bacterium RIFCSPLOWO2_02_FULL_51_9 TaxID=1802410 RepID=A0A1F7VFB4_9BACT|nr:MAG: hypothetical protein A3H75_00120 [Candidatus Uhrbacteria bacterium RIFCSPLOWO2_02_FULL_51_9]
MFRIFITRRIPDVGLNLLKKHKNFHVEMHHEKKDPYNAAPPIPRSVFLKRIRGIHAILPMLTETIDKEAFDAAGPQLKIVANNAVGFNNIDVTEAKKRGVVITNTPGVLNVSVAEHTVALMLALAKRIVEADGFTRAGKFKSWAPLLMLGTQLSGKTLGLVGSGRIGSMVANFAHHGLNMKILYTDVIRYPEIEKTVDAKKVSLATLCKQADVISFHVPLLPSTHHLIDTAQLNLMKKTALLINTARGPVISEQALLKALYNKKIAGAALDVYECEPLIDCDVTDHRALRKLPNVILTPHIASATHEARDEMAAIAARNIVAVLAGKKPLTPVV